jgi:hypothetical protein
VKPWYKFPEGRSRLARDRDVAALYVPKMAYGPLVGKLFLSGEVGIVTEPSGIVRTVHTRIQFDERYPYISPEAFVRKGQFEPQDATRHFRGDRSCCLWFVRAEDGWDGSHSHAFEHFLQQLLVFFDRQLCYDAIGEFPGDVWAHDRPIAEIFVEDRLGNDAFLVDAFKTFRRGGRPFRVDACPCRSGNRFAECHEAEFVDMRQRLSGLKFETNDPSELEKKIIEAFG